MTLEERVQKLEEKQNVLLMALWTLRGELKGTGNAVETKLKPLWDEYRADQKTEKASQFDTE